VRNEVITMQHCRLKSTGMQRCTGQVVPNISKDHCTFICSAQPSKNNHMQSYMGETIMGNGGQRRVASHWRGGAIRVVMWALRGGIFGCCMMNTHIFAAWLFFLDCLTVQI
jgi:hypothetical protein